MRELNKKEVSILIEHTINCLSANSPLFDIKDKCKKILKYIEEYEQAPEEKEE